MTKRLAAFGFVLFIVLLFGCNGGYEPFVVGGDESITPKYNSDDGLLQRVRVNIPKKITYEINNGREEDYEVSWEPDVGRVEWHIPSTDHSDDTYGSTNHFIMETTDFYFTALDPSAVPTITIYVHIRLPNNDGVREQGDLVASKPIPTTNPTP